MVIRTYFQAFPPVGLVVTKGFHSCSPYHELSKADGTGALLKTHRCECRWGHIIPATVQRAVIIIHPPAIRNISYPWLSADGLSLFFSGVDHMTLFRSGGFGGSDMWVTTRASITDPWVTPMNLGPSVNSPLHEEFARLTPDGSTLYFTRGSDSPN